MLLKIDNLPIRVNLKNNYLDTDKSEDNIISED